jgi:hypothetical protein
MEATVIQLDQLTVLEINLNHISYYCFKHYIFCFLYKILRIHLQDFHIILDNYKLYFLLLNH